MAKKRALIAGITGQDGSYLAELLLEKGYQVIGLTRDISRRWSSNIEQLRARIELHYCAYTEHSITEAVQKHLPSEIYNLTGQTYVGKSWELIPETIQNTGVVPTYFLGAILEVDRAIRFFQASSSEIFSPNDGEILTESSPIAPTNPYGCSKAFAHQMVASFRRYHGIYAVNGILFNHESPRRNDDFLSKKVTRTAVAIKLGKESELVLGNLKAARDWGYARDYADAIYRMMHLQVPCDLIISTGKVHTVEDMAAAVFQELGMDWRKYVRCDPALLRAFETLCVYGSNRRIEELTGWAPKTSFNEMIKLMVADETQRQQRGRDVI